MILLLLARGHGTYHAPATLLSLFSPLSGAGENVGSVKPSEAMKKILDEIGEEPNPFNGNDGFGEW